MSEFNIIWYPTIKRKLYDLIFNFAIVRLGYLIRLQKLIDLKIFANIRELRSKIYFFFFYLHGLVMRKCQLRYPLFVSNLNVTRWLATRARVCEVTRINPEMWIADYTREVQRRKKKRESKRRIHRKTLITHWRTSRICD